MGVQFDASQARDFSTTGGTWTHVSVGAPAGMAVLIVGNASTVDNILTVAYGGGTLTRVSSIPGGSGSEPGRSYMYFRGTVVAASGTVNVTANSHVFTCWSVSMTANAAIRELTVAGTVTTTSTSLADPSGTVTGLAAGASGLALGVLFSGANDPASNVYRSGYTAIPHSGTQGVDFGSQSGNAAYGIQQVSAPFTLGWTNTTADDVALIAALIQEPAPATLPPTVNFALEVV